MTPVLIENKRLIANNSILSSGTTGSPEGEGWASLPK
jgi:hypothetical protein